LSEPCPGKRLPRDDDDRQRQVAKILALNAHAATFKVPENRSLARSRLPGCHRLRPQLGRPLTGNMRNRRSEGPFKS
jgi:hypothetical protein